MADEAPIQDAEDRIAAMAQVHAPDDPLRSQRDEAVEAVE